jgi:hypothetical protein
MISHQHLRAPSFRWLLAWAVLLCFGAGGTAYGQPAHQVTAPCIA